MTVAFFNSDPEQGTQSGHRKHLLCSRHILTAAARRLLSLTIPHNILDLPAAGCVKSRPALTGPTRAGARASGCGGEVGGVLAYSERLAAAARARTIRHGDQASGCRCWRCAHRWRKLEQHADVHFPTLLMGRQHGV